jgi:hypothetical protein
MIIDHTYFTKTLSLPQRGNTEGQDLIADFIEINEEIYLKKVLGYDLWKAFITGIEGSGTPDQRWLDLLEGKEFTYLSHNYNWDGFETINKTPIANYVYYKWKEDEAIHSTLVGTAVQNVDNNSKVNPVPKMVDAWNRMVDMNRTLWMFLKANADVYLEWVNESSPVWSWWTDVDTLDCPNEVFRKINSLDI